MSCASESSWAVAVARISTNGWLIFAMHRFIKLGGSDFFVPQFFVAMIAKWKKACLHPSTSATVLLLIALFWLSTQAKQHSEPTVLSISAMISTTNSSQKTIALSIFAWHKALPLSQVCKKLLLFYSLDRYVVVKIPFKCRNKSTIISTSHLLQTWHSASITLRCKIYKYD